MWTKLSISFSIVTTLVGGVSWIYSKTNDKIRSVEINVSTVSERAARLEEAIDTIKKDNAETRNDIKEFIKELNIKKR